MGGVQNLAWHFTGTLIGFYVLFSLVQGAADSTRYDVWVSVFSFFVVLVFWSSMPMCIDRGKVSDILE